MSNIDLDCWQHKLGFLEGLFRGYSAPQEAFAVLKWMENQIEVSTEESIVSQKLDTVIDKATTQQKPSTTPVRIPWTEDQNILMENEIKAGTSFNDAYLKHWAFRGRDAVTTKWYATRKKLGV